MVIPLTLGDGHGPENLACHCGVGKDTSDAAGMGCVRESETVIVRKTRRREKLSRHQRRGGKVREREAG